jgi:threonine dehydratase
MNHRLSLDSIAQAMSTIDPVFLNSPQFVSEPLSAILGCELVVKVETLNPIRSFKGRGASHFVACMATTQPLVCASAGNFGQALAYACRARGIELTVYASVNANPLKLERMRALGARVVLEGADFDAAKLAAKHYAADMGLPMIEDGLQPLLSEGAGTIAIELLREPKPFDALLVSLGNGAMLNGIARWMKANAPRTAIVAVCAEGASAMLESWRASKVIEHPTIDTIADGIGVRVPIPEAVEDMQGIVDEGLLVTDEQMIRAMRLAYEHLGLLLEPSGAAGLAALMTNRERFAGQRVATVLCGGNLTMEQARAWLHG